MEDYYTHRNSAHRYLIQKVDDSGEIQLIDGNGLTDEQHTKIMRLYPHGFSSNSVQDSHMLAMGLGGRRDLLVALGGEHPDKRPKNLPSGDTILYNAAGDAIRIFGKKTIDITHSTNIKLSIGQGLAISQNSNSNSGGAQAGSSSDPGVEASAGQDKDVTMVFTANDITITKGKAVVKLTANNMTLTFDDSVTTMESGKITHKSPNVVIDSPKVQLGGADAVLPIGLCGGGCATKVFGV
jgi:phage gp45-like